MANSGHNQPFTWARPNGRLQIRKQPFGLWSVNRQFGPRNRVSLYPRPRDLLSYLPYACLGLASPVAGIRIGMIKTK